MKKINIVSFSVVCSVLCAVYSTSLYAGAGAKAYGCVYLATKPTAPLKATFTVGSTSCMNNVGSGGVITVADKGLSCLYLGYIEGKSSSSGGDTCASDTSHWNLACSTDSSFSANSDTALSHPFLGSNHAKFNSHSDGVTMCSTASKCGDTSKQWSSGTVGDLYFVHDVQ